MRKEELLLDIQFIKGFPLHGPSLCALDCGFERAETTACLWAIVLWERIRAVTIYHMSHMI